MIASLNRKRLKTPNEGSKPEFHLKWIRELVTGNAAGSADVDVKDTDRVHIRTWRISSTYNIIQQKQLYDEMTEEQQNAVPKERYEEMIADYNHVRTRFVSGRTT